MATRRPYVRPVAGWWRSNPYFLRYLAREATSVFVAAYAFVLLAGLVRLAEGQAAFEGWLAMLRTPVSIAFHVVLLAAFAFHTWSWFAIMPKTLPPVAIAGRRLPAALVTGLGIAAAVACWVVMVALAARLSP
jgi:fumarate reductase subunit C